MAQQWPTGSPSVGPGTHDPVAQQAYLAGGGDYFRSGTYSAGLFGANVTTQSMVLNRLHFTPFYVSVRRAFDRLGLTVTTAAATGGVVRMGIYTGTGIPETLLLDAGTVASTTTGAKQIVISQTLNPGVYWLASVAQVATCTANGWTTGVVPWLGNESIPPNANSTPFPSRYQVAVSGALPATTDTAGNLATDSGTWDNLIAVALRAA